MRRSPFIQWMRIVARLADGKSRRLRDLMDIYEGAHPRTLRRTMQGLCDVPELQIIEYKYEGETMYRMEGKLIPDRPKTRQCNKCLAVLDLESGFYRGRTHPDGFKSICKKCELKGRNAWVAANRKAYNSYQRAQYRKRKRRTASL